MILFLAFLFGISIQMSNFVAARFCEGGHICSLPRECCTQGCCPPYQSGPRQLPPPSEHVLNLFFISHWYFWCVVVAVILAVLCAYSLWKKRRTLCGWGFNEHHVQSEGDSAGSCYVPPQYSRCNSFHHPPPPYTEVTSKPDLYPLVFTCNSDNGKNGSSYLMVQYFRNYIVRPAGSLSAASTVDSLSSSFMCNINEANTLVPPPYSRAASPEIGFSSHFQQQYMMPRSASQLVCQNVNNSLLMGSSGGATGSGQYELNGVVNPHLCNGRNTHYAAVTVNTTAGRKNVASSTGNERERERMANYNANLRNFESGAPYDDSGGDGDDNDECTNDHVNANVINTSNSSNDFRTLPNSSGFVQSQSDQHFHYITNSNSSISDIFINNSCAAGIGVSGGSNRVQQRSEELLTTGSITGVGSVVHPQAGGTPVIYSNGCIKPNPLHRVNTNPTQFHVDSSATREPVFYQSNNSISGISITVPTGIEDSSIIHNDNEIRDLQLLRRSLETCCQLLQQQQKQPSGSFAVGDSPERTNDLAKKYVDDGLLRSYMTSGTCSGVSSLANVGTPSSPPQATSPTGEVKEILDQIRQLQEGVTKYEEDLVIRSAARPILHHTMSSPSPASVKQCTSPALDSGSGKLQRISTMPEQQTLVDAAANRTNNSISNNSSTNSVQSIASTSSVVLGTQSAKMATSKSSLNSGCGTSAGFLFTSSSKRPSTLQHSKKRFYTSKPPNKAMYIPMMATNQLPSGSRCTILKSPVTSMVNSNFFANRGNRQRKGWISRSAPTTPATPLPPSYMGDDSPLLLNEHDEDPEGEQNAEMEN